MLNTDELNFLQEQIKSTIDIVDRENYNLIMSEQHGEPWEEYPGFTEGWLKSRLNDLYIMMLTYLEGKGFPYLLRTFRGKYDVIMQNDDLLLKTIHLPEDNPQLELTYNFRKFLDPFMDFNYRTSTENEPPKIFSILQNTGYILKKLKASITREADIYKEVQWILGLYYPSAIGKDGSSFYGHFKKYNPDILIPEIKTAIEYKLSMEKEII
jgi:hypothetical protein